MMGVWSSYVMVSTEIIGLNESTKDKVSTEYRRIDDIELIEHFGVMLLVQVCVGF